MNHQIFMQRALDIAQQAFVSPNPRVGAVIVYNNKIIAEGWHQKFGEAHAEINAFSNLPSHIPCDQVYLYITLEPCFHHGKTPPCVDKIIELGIKNIIIACLDPNPLVAGQSVQKLKDAGCFVLIGILKEQAEKMNESFFKFIKTKLPFTLLKSAVSLDGKICTSTGESKWISSEESRNEVHLLRSQITAIMVGINTVLKDDPMLTSRIPNGRDPIRIILDSSLRTPLTSKIVETAKDIQTIIATINNDPNLIQKYRDHNIEIIIVPQKNNKIDLQQLMAILGQKNIDSILLEGGATLAYSALEEGIIDKIQIYYAPIIIGGSLSKSFIGGEGISALSQAFKISSYSIRQLTTDFVVEAYL